jgi:hypothetical protein
MLWHFCRARKWVAEALDKTHVPREAEPEKGRVILTVEQTARLMEASTDPDICALNAMVLFGGLRRDEVEKLHWSAVDFKTGHINVSARSVQGCRRTLRANTGQPSRMAAASRAKERTDRFPRSHARSTRHLETRGIVPVAAGRAQTQLYFL